MKLTLTMKNNTEIKLKVFDFGPISNIENEDGFITIKKFTFLIGPQGSGKSTLAKLISTFLWLEKALYTSKVSENEVSENFVGKYCAYFGLSSYFKPTSLISFKGEKYKFEYKHSKLVITKKKNNNYIYRIPKIMYVPSERNFLCSIPNSLYIQGLPAPLATYLSVYDEARRALKGDLILPIKNDASNVSFQYNQDKNVSFIIKNGCKTLLENSASGFQSLVPLFLTTKHVAENLTKRKDFSTQELSVDELRLIKEKLSKIPSNDILLELVNFQNLFPQFYYKKFINIVEEPEQNLYPSTQLDVLFSLFKYANLKKENKLIITTHSPYLINGLTLAIKSKELQNYANNNKEQMYKINKIVSSDARLSGKDYVVYELSEQGNIKLLDRYKDLPTDQNPLNVFLEKFNIDFNKLLDIEDEYY